MSSVRCVECRVVGTFFVQRNVPVSTSGVDDCEELCPIELRGTSSSICVKWCGTFIALLRCFGSKLNLSFPFGLHVNEFAQSVGPSTFAMMP